MKRLTRQEARIVDVQEERLDVRRLENFKRYFKALHKGELTGDEFSQLKRSCRQWWRSHVTNRTTFVYEARKTRFHRDTDSKVSLHQAFSGATINKSRVRRHERRVMPEAMLFGRYSVNYVGDVRNHLNPDIRKLSVHDVIREDKKPRNKSRHIGVEFEFLTKYDRQSIEFAVPDHLLNKVRTTTDGSVKADGYSGLEMPLLTTENSYRQDIKNVCTFLKDGFGAFVNDTCGLHVHLDMRTFDYKKAYNNLVMCLPLLQTIVGSARTNNKYCLINSSPNEIPDSRYYAINACSVERHHTIEVRLHHGSLNESAIINWVTLLRTIAYAPALFTQSINSIEGLRSVVPLSSKMVEYLRARSLEVVERDLAPLNDTLTYEEVA